MKQDSHLGNLVFDYSPEDAICHYEVGMRIGNLSLRKTFLTYCNGAISTTACFCVACMDMVRLWCLGRFKESLRVFEQMLWMNPSDNQGVRFLIDDLKAKTVWAAHNA